MSLIRFSEMDPNEDNVSTWSLVPLLRTEFFWALGIKRIYTESLCNFKSWNARKVSTRMLAVQTGNVRNSPQFVNAFPLDRSHQNGTV